MGYWSYLKPVVKRKHEWIFAKFTEFPSERDDGQFYTAFLFRDENRTTFGIREFVGDGPMGRDFLVMAKRVVVDSEYRTSLISDDKKLKTWWKKKH